MSAMTSTLGGPGIMVRPWGYTSTRDERAAKDLTVHDVPKSSLFYGITVFAAMLSVALAVVIMPAIGPASAEAEQLIQAKETQALAQQWVAMHPEDAVPTGDPRAWGFEEPATQASVSPSGG